MEHLKQQASSKRKLKLGDIAEHLQVKKFVVRTWEKELGLAPQSGGYDADGIELFKKIKQLVVVEQQSLDHVRQIIGASKIASTIQPATLEQEEKALVTNNLDMAPVQEMAQSGKEITPAEEQLCSAPANATTQKDVENAVTTVAATETTTDAIVEVALQEQAYVPAEVLPLTQKTPELIAHAVPETHQKFFADLAFFKQELIRLQKLLKA